MNFSTITLYVFLALGKFNEAEGTYKNNNKKEVFLSLKKKKKIIIIKKPRHVQLMIISHTQNEGLCLVPCHDKLLRFRGYNYNDHFRVKT